MSKRVTCEKNKDGDNNDELHIVIKKEYLAFYRMVTGYVAVAYEFVGSACYDADFTAGHGVNYLLITQKKPFHCDVFYDTLAKRRWGVEFPK